MKAALQLMLLLATKKKLRRSRRVTAKLSLKVSPVHPNALVDNLSKAQLIRLLICFTGLVDCNEEYTASVFDADTDKFESTSYIYVFADKFKNTLLQQVEFHTSCSKPLSIGDIFGSSTLVGFVGENGEATSPDIKPGLNDADADFKADAVSACPGDTLVLTYLVTNNNTENGKSVVSTL